MAYPPAFLRAVKHTLEQEGVFSDHAADHGGATMYGITEAVARRHGYDVRKLTREQAIGIYYEDYWQKPGLSALVNEQVAGELFDTGVNMGIRTAIRIAQKAAWYFGAYTGKIDGVLGPATAAALNKLSGRYHRQLLLCMNGFQFARYVEIADADPSQRQAFFKGWMRRLEVPEGV